MKFLIRAAILKLLVIIMLVSFRHMTTYAEMDVEWSVTIYDRGWNVLVELSPSGSEVAYLPNMVFPPMSYDDTFSLWYMFPHVSLTDDHNYLVSLVQRDDPYVREALITDLHTNEIIPVPVPPMIEGEVFTGYWSGVFNPTMTQIALPYVILSISEACCSSGGIVTVDLATGDIQHVLDMDARFNQSTAWVDAWTDDGIWFAPRCSACTSRQTYNYKIWNPETDTVSPTTNFNDYLQAERRQTSGEVLYSASHPDFPLGGPTSSPLLNTVTYHPPDTFDPSDYGQVVFYDPDYLEFDFRAHWVMNGRAFLVTKDLLRNVVVMRDGRQLKTDYPAPEIFIATTSDGWLTLNEATNTIQHYTVDGDSIVRNILFHVSGDIEVANIQLRPIPYELRPFEIDISPPDDVVFCPGALPTQFQVGDWAQVIVDHEESPIATLTVGDTDFAHRDWHNQAFLPLGARVQILDGPECTPNGWAYMKVDYQGTIGWMLEVWQTDYFLAPSSPP